MYPLLSFATATKENFKDGEFTLPRLDGHERVRTDLRRLLSVENWSEMKVQEALRTLRSFSLLSISTIDDSLLLQLHPLLQAWSRDMDSSTPQHHRAMALQVLATCCKDDAFLLHRYLLPHTLDMFDQPNVQDVHFNDLMSAGKILQRQGNYQAAVELFEVALAKTRKATGDNEKNIAMASGWLAEAYRAQGRYRKAEGLEEEALGLLKRLLWMEHPDTIMPAANLAATYQVQGRWTESVTLTEEVLERRRRILGMEHPHTITAAGNLAVTYRAQGRLSDAEGLEMEALEQSRRVLGMEHPHTIMAPANLAITYHAQGHLVDAEELELGVLERRRRILGTEHPNTIMAAANLATTYAAQGRLVDAEETS